MRLLPARRPWGFTTLRGRRRVTGDPVALGPTVLTRVSGTSDAAMSPTGTLLYQTANDEALGGWIGPRTPFEPVLADPKA